MPGWNFADAWEAIADQLPAAPCQSQGDRRLSWAEVDRRADGVARALLDAGLAEQDKVAQYLYNCPEYLESMFAAFKAGLVPINTNYRYQDAELVYLWDNADCAAVVFHGAFTGTIERIRAQVPGMRAWLWVDDGRGPCPDWAIPYEAATTSRPGRVVAPWGRSGDQLVMLYTGGTTGRPKGVMWRQEDLFRSLAAHVSILTGSEDADPSTMRDKLPVPDLVSLPACPLMHGTGLYTQLMVLALGGSTVTLTARHFDVEELFDTIQRERINHVAIVGDAFAKPMVQALDAHADRWDISSLFLVTSSGVMFSEPVKQGLLKHHPGMILLDLFSSSEAIGIGQSLSSGTDATRTAGFTLGRNAIVITDDGRRVEPGSGEIGRVAVGGHQPLGYYKDPEKTAATFIELDGQRYACPGDYARVEADGSVTLLGRGSVVINTAGEKVFPEEVEEALKTYPGVVDAVAVGVPDERFGEAVTAVIEVAAGERIDTDAAVAHVRSVLAGFKAPRRVLVVDSIGRAPNGKVDYARLRAYAVESTRR